PFVVSCEGHGRHHGLPRMPGFSISLFASLVVLAQANSWIQLSPNGSAPSGRYRLPGAYSETADAFFVFGGRDSGDKNLGDLYIYERQANQWTEPSPSGSAPSARYGHGAAYSDFTDALYIYGGHDGTSNVNDLLIYERFADRWDSVVPKSGSGPAVSGHTATYSETAHALLVFGGWVPGGASDELHLFDFWGNSWTQLSPTGSAPSARYSHSAAYSKTADGLVVFGGFDTSSALNDLYIYNSKDVDWVRIIPSGTAPAIRYWHTGAYSETADALLVFGGFSGASSLNDLHIYKRQDNSWSQLSPSGYISGRWGHAAAYSQSADGFLVFGGDNGGYVNDLYFYERQGTTTTSVSSTQTTSTSTSVSQTTSTTTSVSQTTSTSTSVSQTTSTTTSVSQTISTSTSVSQTTSTTTSVSQTKTISTSTSVSQTTSTTTSVSQTKTISTSTSVSQTTSTTSASTSTISGTTSSTGTSTRSTSSAEANKTAASSADIINELQHSTRAVVSQLTDAANESSTATVFTDLGLVAAVQLPSSSMSLRYELISPEGSSAVAVLPMEPLQQALGDLEDTAVVVATLDGPRAESLVDGKVWTDTGRPIQAVAPAVDASLVDRRTLSVREVRLTTPIYLRVADVAPEPNFICAYFDGEFWSTQGVRLATVEELQAFGSLATMNISGGVWCATLHLSIFAVFIDILLDCTNANMLTPEGIKEIVERTDWWARPPALGLWLLLSLSLLLVAFGCLLDARTWRSGLWRDEYFHGDLPPSLKQPGGCRRCIACAKDSAGHPEHPTPTVPEGPLAHSSTPSLRHIVSESPMQLQFMLQRAKPTLMDGLEEQTICRNTLWEAARRHGLHNSSIEMHIWGQRGWVPGSLATQRSPLLKEMALQMEESLPSAFVRVHTSRCHRLWAALVATHPVYELCLCDLHMTSAKRAKITVNCILGSLAFVALFFSVDGSAVAARSPADCPIEQGSLWWYTFVVLFSVMLSFLPRSLEYHLAWRSFVRERRNRRWQLFSRRCKDFGFWFSSTALSFFYLLVIMAFLADLAEADEFKWMFTFAVVIVRKLLLVPLTACLLSGLGTELAIARSGEPIPPKKLGLDLQLASSSGSSDDARIAPTEPGSDRQVVWDRKVQELAGRGLSIRQLLDFYASLGYGSMEHFDPVMSTTHDVVRQAIIPRSLQLRESRCFVVQVHQASLDATSASEPYCTLAVKGPGAVTKPWKGAGRTACAQSPNPVWEEAFLLEDLYDDDSLTVNILSGHDHLGSVFLAAETFWQGLTVDQQCSDAGGNLRVSITAFATREKAREAKEAMHATSISGSTSGIASVQGQMTSHVDLGDAADVDELTTVRSGFTPRKIARNASRGILAEQEEEAVYRGYAYATVVSGGRAHLAVKMVTHSWRNKFAHLLAAILADALEAEMYLELAQDLAERNFLKLAEALRKRKKLDVRYWVCAFSVNQHTGICATPPPADSTGHAITPCGCSTEKHFTGDLSEMNKFDDMMAYLKTSLRRQGKARLEQVVALEADFSLFTRVWCLAELVEARELHLPQAMKIHSTAARDLCLDRLARLDVRQAEASFPADKDLVLSKITDPDGFNVGLQDLVLHRLDTFLQGNRAHTASTLFDELVLATLSVVL
ncbi:ACBP4, partial [Symbiodinium natans]